MQLDMSWIDDECRKFIQRKANEYSLTGSEAVKVFRKRSSVSAFRITCLCYYLYALEYGFDPTQPLADNLEQRRAQFRCRRIYRFMAEFIIQQMLRRWGKKFNELNAKRAQEEEPLDNNLFAMLTPEFSRDQLKVLIKQIGSTTPAKQFLWMWGPKKMDIIEAVDKNHFRKKKYL